MSMNEELGRSSWLQQLVEIVYQWVVYFWVGGSRLVLKKTFAAVQKIVTSILHSRGFGAHLHPIGFCKHTVSVTGNST